MSDIVADKKEIEQIIKQRRIDGLYHFTPAENLKSIFQNGIVPRKTLVQNGITFQHTDDERKDMRKNTVSTSISFPNHKMFSYKRKKMSSEEYMMAKRKRKPISEKDWAVLRLDTDIMCDFKCAYFWSNAACHEFIKEERNEKGELIKRTPKPIEQRMGKEAFEELFYDYEIDEFDGSSRRARNSLSDAYPTDPQAEVMVFGTIPIHYILNVYFEDVDTLKKYRDSIFKDDTLKKYRDSFLTEIPFSVNKEVF